MGLKKCAQSNALKQRSRRHKTKPKPAQYLGAARRTRKVTREKERRLDLRRRGRSGEKKKVGIGGVLLSARVPVKKRREAQKGKRVGRAYTGEPEKTQIGSSRSCKEPADTNVSRRMDNGQRNEREFIKVEGKKPHPPLIASGGEGRSASHCVRHP